jgi:hypothetical protein
MSIDCRYVALVLVDVVGTLSPTRNIHQPGVGLSSPRETVLSRAALALQVADPTRPATMTVSYCCPATETTTSTSTWPAGTLVVSTLWYCAPSIFSPKYDVPSICPNAYPSRV